MSVQQEKENLQQELERSQKDLGDAYHMKAELEMTREESFTLKSQLDEEEQNRYEIILYSRYQFLQQRGSDFTSTIATTTLIHLSANQMSLVCPIDKSDCLKIGIR